MSMGQIVTGGHSGQGNLNPQKVGEGYDHISEHGEYTAKKLGKSFVEHVAEYPVVLDGMDSSEFLNDLVMGIAKSFHQFEASMVGMIKSHDAENTEFDQSLGAAMLHIGKSVQSVGGRVENLQKSTNQMQKSLSARTNENVPQYITKSMLQENPVHSRLHIMKSMETAVEKGLLSATELVKFETTGQIDEQVAKSLGVEV
jgi:hypothetical protein